MDLVRGPADVNGRPDLLRPEVIDQVLVIGLDELPVGVRPDQRARGGRIGIAEADLRAEHGVADLLGVLGAEAHQVVDERRVVDRVQAHDLGIAQEHRDRPRPDQHRAEPAREPRRRECLALLEERRQAPGLLGIGDLQAREPSLVVLQHVLIDRRDDVVRVLHAAADGLRLLGEIVEGDHDVRLVALVVVEHRPDGLRGVRAVFLDREPVEAAGERSRDRIRRHAIRVATLVGGDDPFAPRHGLLAQPHAVLRLPPRLTSSLGF